MRGESACAAGAPSLQPGGRVLDWPTFELLLGELFAAAERRLLKSAERRSQIKGEFVCAVRCSLCV